MYAVVEITNTWLLDILGVKINGPGCRVRIAQFSLGSKGGVNSPPFQWASGKTLLYNQGEAPGSRYIFIFKISYFNATDFNTINFYSTTA